MATRRSKTVTQQCKYYEVDNIYEYMVSTYINGNRSTLKRLYKELNIDTRKEFISYCFSEMNPQYLEEIVTAVI